MYPYVTVHTAINTLHVINLFHFRALKLGVGLHEWASRATMTRGTQVENPDVDISKDVQ